MAMEEMVKQEGARDAKQYRRRVKLLAAIYFFIGLLTIVSMGLIAWRIKFWVTFSQRSNVETLTFALIFVLFAYLLVRTFSGFVGSIRMLWYNGLRRIGSKDDQIEITKQAALKDVKKGEVNKRAYTDVQMLKSGDIDKVMRIPLEDDAGKVGELEINGVRLWLKPSKWGVSNSVFEYIVNQIENAINDCPERHSTSEQENNDEEGDEEKIDISLVEWQEIDDDEALEYYHQVEAFRRLARKMGEDEQFWPSIVLHDKDVQFITEKMREVIPTIRDECFLPDVEYSAEYHIPIIPEPLGFISLTRNESRADPVATMGCAAVIAMGITALLVYMLIVLPWVPGK